MVIMHPIQTSVYIILQFIWYPFWMYFNMSSVVKLEIELFPLLLTNFPVEGTQFIRSVGITDICIVDTLLPGHSYVYGSFIQ